MGRFPYECTSVVSVARKEAHQESPPIFSTNVTPLGQQPHVSICMLIFTFTDMSHPGQPPQTVRPEAEDVGQKERTGVCNIGMLGC